MVPILFVGGTGRCGTTAMKNALNVAPNICALRRELRIHVEDGGMLDLIEKGRSQGGAGWESRLEYLRATHSSRLRRGFYAARIKQHADWLYWQVPPQPTALSKQRRIAKEYFRRIFDPKPHHELIVEDSPPNMQKAVRLARVLPSARFIHMVRHPRQVLASTWAKPWAKATPMLTAQYLAETLDECLRQIDELEYAVVQVRLEDLVQPDGSEAKVEALKRIDEIAPEVDMQYLATGRGFDAKHMKQHELEPELEAAYQTHLTKHAENFGYVP